MNKIFSIVTMFVLFLGLTINEAYAQKEFTQGSIKMEVTEVKSDDPSVAAQLDMMKGSTTVVYFDGKKSLTKMDMMGGMMEMAIISDVTTKAGFMLFKIDVLGQKIKIDITEEEAAKRSAESSMSDIKVTYDKSDVKTIAGYKCHKATIKAPQMGDATIIAYVTDAIKFKTDIIQGIDSKFLEGFPLQYEMGAQGVSMVYTATEIKDVVDPEVFNIKTAGYETQTMEEFQQTMGALGGMGF